MTDSPGGTGIEVHAGIRVERGTATTCACGGQLGQQDGAWRCADCGREYT